MSQTKGEVSRKVELEVGTDGVIRTIYSDELPELAKKMGAEISTVCRASNVEWEVREKTVNHRLLDRGWSVRAVHDPELAIRVVSHCARGTYDGGWFETLIVSKDSNTPIALFEKREQAIEQEKKFFFELLPERRK